MMTSSNGNMPPPPPHEGQWRGALMFSLICAWINGWVNNREAGDLRRYRAHYDVIVMEYIRITNPRCGSMPCGSLPLITNYCCSSILATTVYQKHCIQNHSQTPSGLFCADMLISNNCVLRCLQNIVTCVTDFHAPGKTRKPINLFLSWTQGCDKLGTLKPWQKPSFFKCGRTQRLWEKYRKPRNTATKIKVSSMRKYFDDKCNSEKAVWN